MWTFKEGQWMIFQRKALKSEWRSWNIQNSFYEGFRKGYRIMKQDDMISKLFYCRVPSNIKEE